MKLPAALSYIAMVTYLVGVVLKVIDLFEAWIPALVGSCLLGFVRIYYRVKSDTKNKSSKATRLPAIQMFSAGLMIYSAYLMYMHKGYWILPVAIAAILELYSSYRMPKE